jgi:8-oxo-dGTP diphosphatase
MATKRFTAPVTIHLFFIKDHQILLLRRFNTGYEDGNYSVVAGHLDGGETVKQAAVREAKEEAGVHLTEENIEIVGVMHRKAGDERIDFFATMKEWEGEIKNQEPHKCDDLRFFPLDQLPVNTIRAIDNYKKGKWFDSFGWTERKRSIEDHRFQKTAAFVIQLKRYAFLRNDFRFQEGDSLAFAELNYSVKKQKSESDPERKAV